MRNIFFGSLCVIVLLFSCKNKQQEIITQNNIIVEDQQELYRLNDALFVLFEQDAGEQECVEQYDSLSKFIKACIFRYDTIQPAGEDQGLVSAMQNFLKNYWQLTYNEYRKLLYIVIKPRYEFTAQDIIDVDSLYVLIAEKQQKIDSEFANNQEAFLKKHGIRVVSQ